MISQKSILNQYIHSARIAQKPTLIAWVLTMKTDEVLRDATPTKIVNGPMRIYQIHRGKTSLPTKLLSHA